MKHLKYAFRSLKKDLKLTLINVLCMSVGLVSAGIIFAYVNQEFNYDSGKINSERIYKVIQKEGETLKSYTYAPLAEALKLDLPEIENAIRVSFFNGYLACHTGENKFNETSTIFADPDFFSLLNIHLVRGNNETCLHSLNSAVISEKAVQKYFGKVDPIGKQIRIGENQVFSITGVFQNFKSNSNFQGDLVLPIQMISKLTQMWLPPDWRYETDIHTFILASNEVNAANLSLKTKDFISKYKADDKEKLSFHPLKNIHIEKEILWESTAQTNVTYLYILSIVAVIILCVSCANFLFLYIGSTSQQSTNTGIKKVFGASKSALFLEHFRGVTILMFFSILIATVLFIVYQSDLIYIFPSLPKIETFDYRLLLLLTAVVIAVTLLSGIYPAIVLSSQSPISILSSEKKIARGKVKLVNLLVIGQFTLSVVLIASTLLMHKQIDYLENQDTGYAKDELITIPLNMKAGHGICNDKFDIFTQELKKFSGVKNASLAYSSPSSIDIGDNKPNWEGKADDKELEMNWAPVFYNYFETLGLRIVQGRSFSREYQSDAVNMDKKTSAFILNERAVKEMGIHDPIGKGFEVWGFKGQIIGVVEDYNFRSLHSEITPLFFQVHPFFLNEIIVRIDPESPTVFSDIETVWNKFVVDYPLEFNFVTNHVLKLYQPEKNLADTLNIFSMIAIVIACMGLFTLTILTMNQRTKEIGIRKVNGATVSEILIMLNMDFIKWVAIAFIIATPIAYFAMSKWLENFAYKTELNWWIFALSGVLVLAIALLTVSWQSWRAATRNPVEALRYE